MPETGDSADSVRWILSDGSGRVYRRISRLRTEYPSFRMLSNAVRAGPPSACASQPASAVFADEENRPRSRSPRMSPVIAFIGVSRGIPVESAIRTMRSKLATTAAASTSQSRQSFPTTPARARSSAASSSPTCASASATSTSASGTPLASAASPSVMTWRSISCSLSSPLTRSSRECAVVQ